MPLPFWPLGSDSAFLFILEWLTKCCKIERIYCKSVGHQPHFYKIFWGQRILPFFLTARLLAWFLKRSSTQAKKGVASKNTLSGTWNLFVKTFFAAICVYALLIVYGPLHRGWTSTCMTPSEYRVTVQLANRSKLGVSKGAGTSSTLSTRLEQEAPFRGTPWG